MGAGSSLSKNHGNKISKDKSKVEKEEMVQI